MKFLSVTFFSFLLLSARADLHAQKTIDQLQTVIISKNDTIYKFHTITLAKKSKAISSHNYYWYSSDSIIITQGGSGARVLDGRYESYYPNKSLLEKGEFKGGLKDGTWISWYPNGIIKRKAHWKNGEINGTLTEFSQSGKTIRSEKYKRGKYVSSDKKDK